MFTLAGCSSNHLDFKQLVTRKILFAICKVRRKLFIYIKKKESVGKTHFFTASDYLQSRRVHKAGVLKKKWHTSPKHYWNISQKKEDKGEEHYVQLVLKWKQKGDSPCSPHIQDHPFPSIKVVMHSTSEKKTANGGKNKTMTNLSDEIAIKKMPSENITWR